MHLRRKATREKCQALPSSLHPTIDKQRCAQQWDNKQWKKNTVFKKGVYLMGSDGKWSKIDVTSSDIYAAYI